MNWTDLLTPVNVMVAVVLGIQIYKLARPMLAKTADGKKVVDTVDRAWKFIYDKAGPLYLIVEALARKGVIAKSDKPGQFLAELRNEALKHGIQLSPEQEAEAAFIAKTEAALDHQPVPMLTHLPVNPPAALPESLR